MGIAGLGLEPDLDRELLEVGQRQPAARRFGAMRSTSCSLTVKFTKIGSIATMVASWVGEETPTSSPTETIWALTTPSNGATTLV